MSLDIGNFISNRRMCKTCLRDKKYEGRRIIQPTTEVLQKCPECGSPITWIQDGVSGKREKWIWVRGKGPVRKGVLNNRRKPKIRIDIN